MKKAYVDFIRYSLGVESNIPASIGEINWHELYAFAQKQSISGLLAKTILNIDGTITMDDWRGNKPIDDDVLEWMMDYNMHNVNTKDLWILLVLIGVKYEH